MADAIGALVFEPILKEKVWGDRRLARYGKRLPGAALVGESWEIADLAQTSASGGGGGAARSVVASGPMKGKTITELVRTMGAELLGEAKPHEWEDGPAFPLLIKLLDAGQHLSVQVHPSPAYAAVHSEANLKTESWVVLEGDDAELPGGARIGPGVYHGFNGPTTGARLREAAERGGVEALMRRFEANVGDCHTLPSGTCHALGAGVLVAEVQTPSDTTFRVYDWAEEYGRTGRELHLDQSIECIETGDSQIAPEPARAEGARTLLAKTAHYSIESVKLGAGESFALGEVTAGAFDADRCVVLMVCRGSVLTDGPAGAADLSMGTTALVVAREVSGTSVGSGGGAWVLVVRPG